MISTILIIGCDSLQDIELPQSQNLIVVEGMLTDQSGPHLVSISRSVSFNEGNTGNPIINANVQIVGSNGNMIELFELQEGKYYTHDTVRGKVNEFYQLRFSLEDGTQYISSFEQLKPVPVLDSLIFETDGPVLFEGQNQMQEYFPIVFATEPATNADYYRWKIYRNGELFNEPEDFLLLTDRFINGNEFRNELKDYTFFESDTATVELQSLTAEAYEYFRLFVRQTTDLGTPAGTAPIILRGNIQNSNDNDEVVLGYFNTSSVSAITGVIN